MKYKKILYNNIEAYRDTCDEFRSCISDIIDKCNETIVALRVNDEITTSLLDIVLNKFKEEQLHSKEFEPFGVPAHGNVPAIYFAPDDESTLGEIIWTKMDSTYKSSFKLAKKLDNFINKDYIKDIIENADDYYFKDWIITNTAWWKDSGTNKEEDDNDD